MATPVRYKSDMMTVELPDDLIAYSKEMAKKGAYSAATISATALELILLAVGIGPTITFVLMVVIFVLGLLLAGLLREIATGRSLYRVIIDDENQTLQVMFLSSRYKRSDLILGFSEASYCYDRDRFTLGKPVRRMEVHSAGEEPVRFDVRIWPQELLQTLGNGLESSGMEHHVKCPPMTLWEKVKAAFI